MEARMRVLLVEDEVLLRRSLEKYLERAGHTFESCSTAREAEALAQQFRHDVVIVDYQLPDANGTTILPKLMRISPQVKAIVISEYDLQMIAKEMEQANVDAFLKKPFDVIDLEAALASAFSRARMCLKDVEGM